MTDFNLRGALMLVCLLIFAASFTALLIAAWLNHRADKLTGENFHSALWVEISWTIVPCLIVLALVWPTVKMFLTT
ncbi:MAG: cytochrome c oxidase subunit II transmembrane domain-containing protein [Rhodoferax sp.]